MFDKSWRCVQGVKGRYTMAYFDFVEDPTSSLGAYLYVTNDWIIDGESGAVPNDCYNVFHVATGAGREQWEVRVYGDATVWVAKNGVMMQERHDPVGGAFGGATGFGPSPNVAFNHTIFELRFPASTGRVKMQLGNPVRTVDGPMNTAAQEAASMHRSATGGGGCTGLSVRMRVTPAKVSPRFKPRIPRMSPSITSSSRGRNRFLRLDQRGGLRRRRALRGAGPRSWATRPRWLEAARRRVAGMCGVWCAAICALELGNAARENPRSKHEETRSIDYPRTFGSCTV